jgi:ribosomal protein L11 methyltransferase
VIRLAVRVQREHAELVLAQLLELAPAGVEETGDGDNIEYAVYGAPGELPSLPSLQAAAGDALVQVTTREIPDDWGERWKRFHKPVVVYAPGVASAGARAVRSFVVRPPWEAAAGEAARGGDGEAATGRSSARVGEVEEIVIDPGQAFGTGAHATTRQCLALLLVLRARERSRGALVDVGTGSGVLAIAAARLGFAPVIAIDNERESVAAAADNAATNGVQIEVRRGHVRDASVLEDALGGGAAPATRPVVVANLLYPLLCELAAALPYAPTHVIAGGMLPEQVEPVTAEFASRLGMGVRERASDGGWAAVWLAADSVMPTALGAGHKRS